MITAIVACVGEQFACVLKIPPNLREQFAE
jgi:hypothetical protein